MHLRKGLGMPFSAVNLTFRVFYRFGVGDYDWKEFASRLKQKTFEEIKEYLCYFFR